MQTCRVGGEKTIGDPPTDLSPEDGYRVEDGRGGAPNHRSIKEDLGQERAC